MTKTIRNHLLERLQACISQYFWSSATEFIYTTKSLTNTFYYYLICIYWGLINVSVTCIFRVVSIKFLHENEGKKSVSYSMNLKTARIGGQLASKTVECVSLIGNAWNMHETFQEFRRRLFDLYNFQDWPYQYPLTLVLPNLLVLLSPQQLWH